MHVLCDTCSVLMLLRISPAMFADARFGCVTVQDVYQEFTQTRKFKEKYPWRTEFRQHIRSITPGALLQQGFERRLSVVQALAGSTRRQDTGRPYGLSPTDERIAAAVVVLGATISTGDANLAAFLSQQFGRENVAPLRLVNDWLAGKLIEWNDARQAVLDDWIAQNERPQPEAEIRRFEKLAGRSYPA